MRFGASVGFACLGVNFSEILLFCVLILLSACSALKFGGLFLYVCGFGDLTFWPGLLCLGLL